MLALSGQDLLLAWDAGQGQHPLDRALTLLHVACPEATCGELAALPVGERDLRLLRLREANFGPTLKACSECPGCRERVEFEVSAPALRASAQASGGVDAPGPRTLHVLETEAGPISFRLPDSRDLAAVVAAGSAEEARRRLLNRCVVRPGREGEAVADLAPETVDQLARRMEECAPLADVGFDLSCPACDTPWQVMLDIGGWLWTEVGTQAERLLREVDALARVYGWREADILAMSPGRRRSYLELIGA